jgi:hypothetical protein
MKILATHLMKSKTKAGAKCIIVFHFAMDGRVYKEWLLKE